jgi:hypothetical protein
LDTKPKIAKIIKDLNQSVVTGNTDDIDSFFHDNVKILSPDMKILGDGKAVCIKSYVDFIDKAKIEQYDHEITNVFIYDNTAIVFYTYSMTWVMEGKTLNDQGKELYVLTKNNDDWLIILRKLVSKE